MTGRPFRSGALWSYVPLPSCPLSSADCCPTLIALFYCLLFKIVCWCWCWCFYCLLHGCLYGVACVDSTHSSAGHSSLMKGTSWNEWPWYNGTACAVRGPLKRTWYAASWPLASQHGLPPCHFVLLLLPGMLLGNREKPCCFQCLLHVWSCIVQEFAGLRLACNICSPSHSLALAKSSLKPVRLLP